MFRRPSLHGFSLRGFALLAILSPTACSTDTLNRALGDATGGSGGQVANDAAAGGGSAEGTGAEAGAAADASTQATGGTFAGGISAGGTSGTSSGGTSTETAGATSAGGASVGDGTVGDTFWVRQFGTTGDDTANSVAVDGSGNVYIAGGVAGGFPGQTNFGGSFDAYLRKYDAAGTQLWTRQFGSSDSDIAASVAVDGADNVYVAGATGAALPGQTSAGAWDVFVRKYDSAGIELWTKQFGSSGYDGGEVAVDPNGNVYVSGFTENGLPGVPTDADAGAAGDAGDADGSSGFWTYTFVRKYDSAGSELWTRQFGASGGHVIGYPSVDLAGNVYVAGTTDGTLPGQVSAGGDDAFVRKYDNSGVELWTRQFGSNATDDARVVAVDAAGNVYVPGLTNDMLPGQTSMGNSDAYLRKYDASGTELWTRQFGSFAYDRASSVKLHAGVLYVGGETSGTLPGQIRAGSMDAFVLEYSDSGAELGTRQFGTSSIEQAITLSIDDDGRLYAAGNTNGIFPEQSDPNLGFFDAFLMRLQ